MSKSLTASGLAKAMAADMGMSKALATDIVTYLFAKIELAVKEERTVSMGLIGTLKTARRKARTGRNPKTGESVQIPEKVAVRFKPSSGLKRELNPVESEHDA